MAEHGNDVTYSTSILFGALCKLVDVEPLAAVTRAGLPTRIASGNGIRIGADDFFRLWDAIVQLADREDFPVRVGAGMAASAVAPVFFAFSCAPDLQTGFERFARYKHIFGPVGIKVDETRARLDVRLLPVHPHTRVPENLAAPILIFLNEMARSCSASALVPEQVRLPMSGEVREALAEVFGIKPSRGEPRLIYSEQDARLRLVSENTLLWNVFEPDLDAQVAVFNQAIPMPERVRACLLDAIADRDPSVAYVCERLSTSRSALLRELQRQGVTFQQILDEIRETLALRYLRNSVMPIKQIAYLLAYSDANAFHRAFKSWTGRTPGAVRTTQTRVATGSS